MSCLRRHISTKRFFRHIIAGRRKSPGPAPAAYLPIAAKAALAFELITVTHPGEIRIVVPYIRKLILQNIAAFNR